MATDKILRDSTKHNGTDNFPVVPLNSYPIGKPRRLFHSDYHNGVSGYPADSFMPVPISANGYWSLDEAAFVNQNTNDGSLPNLEFWAATITDVECLCVIISTDGTKMYLIRKNTASPPPYPIVIYQYSLSIAWDITSHSLITQFDLASLFSVNDEVTYACFKPDGTKIYIKCIFNSQVTSIHECSLSTPWDVSTITYNSVKVSLTYLNSLEESHSDGFCFKPDGTKLYSSFYASSTEYIAEYSLSTAWDFSSFSHTNNAALTEVIIDFAIKQDDGLELYATQFSVDTKNIHKYTFGTAWDISTLGSKTIVADYNYDLFNFYLNSDATQIILTQYTYQSLFYPGYKFLKQYLLSDTVLETNTNVLTLDPSLGTVESIQLSDDGLKMFLAIDRTYIKGYTLTEAYNIVSAVENITFTPVETGNVWGFLIANNGTKLYISYNDGINEYTLSAAWDISSPTHINTKYISPSIRFISLSFNNTGNELILSRRQNIDLYIYPLTTPWDISTIGTNTYFDPFPNLDNYIYGVINIGDKLFIFDNGIYIGGFGNTYRRITQFSLSTPWDITTAEPEITYSFVEQIFAIQHRGYDVYGTISSNGKYFYVAGGYLEAEYRPQKLFQFSLTSNCTNCHYVNNLTYNTLFDITNESTNIGGIAIADSTMLILNNTNNTIYVYDVFNYISTARYLRSHLLVYTDMNAVNISLGKNAWIKLAGDGHTYKHVFYIVDSGTNHNILQGETYGENGWFNDSTNISYAFSVATQTTQPIACYVPAEGDKLFVLSSDAIVYYYEMDFNNVSSSVFITSKSLTETNSATGISFTVDGFKMYITDTQNNKILQYNLSTRWDVTTAAITLDKLFSSETTNANGLFASPKGDKFYIGSDTAPASVLEYTI